MSFRGSWFMYSVCVLAGFFVPDVSLSQQRTAVSDVRTLDPVVVSATKTPVSLRQVTSAVEVLTEQDFTRRKVKTLLEVLRLSPGVAVIQNGGPGTAANLRIRGGTANQTLVLIDGAIVNSATLGEFDFSNVTTDNIEKIEIVRGAQSTLWGADAMGGVVNITTKRGRGPLKAGGFFEYGSFNTLREGGHVSGGKGPVDFSLALSRWDTTGISAINDRRGASERDAYRNWQASSRLGVTLPADGRFDFNFRWWSGSLNIDSSSGIFPSPGPSDVIKARNDDTQFIFSGIYRQPVTDWWTHALTLSRAQGINLFDPGILQRDLSTGRERIPFGGPTETRVVANRVESQHDFRLNQYVIVTAGYQLREQTGENDVDLSEKILSAHAGFGQVQFSLDDRLVATAGVRHDGYNTFGDATTYRVTGGYLAKETNTKLRGSYATGFRAPTINDLFWPDYGNPDVQPEKSQSFDVGVDQTLFADRVKISGGYFWNRYRDLIFPMRGEVCVPLSRYGSCAGNVRSAKSQGWEVGVELILARDQPWMKRLELKGHYTMTLTRNLVTGTRLSRWPVDQASLSVRYQPIDPLSMTLDFRFVGSQFNNTDIAQNDTQRLGSFDVLNLAVTYDVSERIEAYVRVDNLLDEEYEEILFYGTPGRSIFGGVRVNIDLPLLSN